MVFSWNSSHMPIFLYFYKNYECLWNKRSPNYYNASARDNAYKCLLRDLHYPELTVADVKTKIKGIRTSYASQLAKIKKSPKTYVSTLSWFEQADEFLRMTVKSTSKQRPSKLETSLKKNLKIKDEERKNEIRLEQTDKRYTTIPICITGNECRCKMSCFSSVDDATKLNIIRKMNTFSTKDEQDIYLQGLIEAETIKRRRPRSTGDPKARNINFRYFALFGIKRTNVCKKAFISLHGITEKRVRRLCELLCKCELPKDKRREKKTGNSKGS